MGSSIRLHSIQPTGKSAHLFEAEIWATNLSSVHKASRKALMRLSIRYPALTGKEGRGEGVSSFWTRRPEWEYKR